VAGPTDRDLMDYLASGRRLLTQASETYGRALGPAEYWWMGVGLAGSTLAELGGKSFVVSRLEQLIDRLGHKGLRGDWLQQMVDELAQLNAQGLLWPVYERQENGTIEPTGLAVQSGFDGEAAYFLALAHIGVAVAVHRADQGAVTRLAQTIAEMVETGVRPDHEALILGTLQPQAEAE